jgi:hypothetical protein
MEEELDDVKMNSVVWISSLREDEQGVTRRVLEDLVPFLEGKGAGFTDYYPESADELYEIFDTVWENTKGTAKPLIHIDMHGHPERGLHIVHSVEDVPWNKLLDCFREININMGNSLVVVSTACFGFHMLAQGELVLTKPTPFLAIVASENEVPAGLLEERTVPFYRDLLERQDISGSSEHIWGDKLRPWRAEMFMFETLLNYVLRFTKGKGLRERRERILTEGRKQGIITDANISFFRKLARESLKPHPRIIARTRREFFLNRPIGFTFQSLMSAASDMEKVIQRTDRRKGGYRPLARFKKH